jgi:membrane protein DedA with SNARE-associated domain
MLDHMDVDAWLHTIPPLAVYAVIAAVIGLESLGIPLPGEIMLVAAALMASRPGSEVNPVGVGVAAVAGAAVGDSIGYTVGRRLGMPLFDWLGQRFPHHFGPGHVALAERLFHRWGSHAVFFGRFIAVLRIFAGPLAGALKMHYPRFLVANVSGAICWAGGTTALVYYAGMAAERWLERFSWIGLVVAVVGGTTVAIVLRRRTSRLVAELGDQRYRESDAPPGSGGRGSEPTHQ